MYITRHPVKYFRTDSDTRFIAELPACGGKTLFSTTFGAGTGFTAPPEFSEELPALALAPARLLKISRKHI